MTHPQDPRVPPVQGSPVPNYDPPLETPTGRFELGIGALKKEIKVEKIWNISIAIIAMLLSLGSVFTGYRIFLGDARAQTKELVDAGLQAQQLQIDAIQKQVTIVEEGQKAVRTALKDLQLDVRESYKAARYDRPSPRLDAPPPPIFFPDGGVR